MSEANSTPSRFGGLRRGMVHRIGKKFLSFIRDYQGRHSRISTEAILPNELFAWVSDLETMTPHIREEFERVWRRPDDIPSFHEISPDQARISAGNYWKTYAFYVFGHQIATNCLACPRTTAALANVPGIQNAWFSILAPGYHIPPHRGPTRALVRCHLGLRVPAQASDCWIRVSDQRCHWHEGQCLVFDDTYEHEVHNETQEYRAVLFIDFDRPMDWLGTYLNRGILWLMQGTHYVKDPLRNLSAWNRRLAERDQ